MKEERTDGELLREFAEERSEAAFSELVRRHIDLVYSTGLRHLRGDEHSAADVTQAVFSQLAHSARKLWSYQSLAGWLYTTTRFLALRAVRSEMRRTFRERDYAMNRITEPGDAGWDEIEGVLDDAMLDLSSGDREAVLLRYFRQETYSRIGAHLGASENAARMRVDRALEKLRAALGRRGVKSSGAVLSAILTTHAVSAAPVGMIASIVAPAVASAGAAASFAGVASLLEFMATAKVKTAIAVLAVTGASTGWLGAHRASNRLQAEIAQLRLEASAPQSAIIGNPRPLTTEELERFQSDRSELMRLRAEVTELRKQLRAQPNAPAGAPARKDSAMMRLKPEEEEQEQLKNLGIGKLNIAKGWGLAFYRFAQENGGMMPGSFEEAAQNYPEVSQEVLRLTGGAIGDPNGDGFEMMFQGRLEDIENPAEAIVIREKEPFHVGPDGSAQKTYLFADGHSEIHTARRR